MLQSARRPGNLTYLQLVVQTENEPTTGTYTITPLSSTANTTAVWTPDGGGGINLPFASASFGQTDVSCVTTTDEAVSAGSITLTTVKSGEVAGSFDLMFPNGDHLAGTFDAPVCALPSGGTTTTCGG